MNRFDDDTVTSDDRLDSLLREWHQESATHAKAMREQLLRELRSRRAPRVSGGGSVAGRIPGRFAALRYARLAASLAIVGIVAAMLVPPTLLPQAGASPGIIQVADGGNLEARDDDGVLLGPCPLKHTDVNVEISAFFSRVTVRQQFRNTYDRKIEAVYTFPLSERGAVDRMRIIIDEERIVEGEVKEREQARRIYESARDAGQIAALLEQERANIFTQSVANIEPGARIDVEISYIEMLEQKDGVYSFAFPMTVAPRYIPGGSTVSPALVPAELNERQGVVLLGPPTLVEVFNVPQGKAAENAAAPGDAAKEKLQRQLLQSMFEELDLSPEAQARERERWIHAATPVPPSLQGGKLQAMLTAARSIDQPPVSWWGIDENGQAANLPSVWAHFEVSYCNGQNERGMLFVDGVGQIAGRWFYADPKIAETQATGWAQNTAQVPDASRITPMPVKPPKRAGHDISLTVTIATGGPAITSLESELHGVVYDEEELDSDVTLTLAKEKELPNRDFVLHWTQENDAIEEATFVHADARKFPEKPGFFTLVLAPPARVAPEMIPPRELIFVLDTSGSMSGLPIEKAKEVMTRGIDAMRAGDTFNVITFAGHTSILWETPRPNTPANRAEAIAHVNGQRGGGGTEMMKAIDAALNPRTLAPAAPAQDMPLTVEQLADLPADGREVRVRVKGDRFTLLAQPNDFVNTTDGIRFGENGVMSIQGPFTFQQLDATSDWLLTGAWVTAEGERRFVVRGVELAPKMNAAAAAPDIERVRIVMFLTDGEVGNDMAIIEAVKEHAKSTRVFSFGIGNSVNRYLLSQMAAAARGEVEFVTQASDPDAAVERFVRRIESPVLTDIELAFSEGVEVSDLLPVNPAGLIPDLYDERPLVLQGRYARPGKGTLTITGRTGAGPFERTIELELPAEAPEHDTIATIWARTKIDEVMSRDLDGIQQGNPQEAVREEIIALGEQFGIMSQFTSFVAVEKSRVTIGGRPMLVTVPIELPNDTRWEGFFGPDGVNRATVAEAADRVMDLGMSVATILSGAASLGPDAIAEASEETRQQVINGHLRLLRELQMQQRYPEALLVIERILMLDPDSAWALALRDAIQTAGLWQEFLEEDRQREFNVSYQFQESREATMPRLSANGLKSTTGVQGRSDSQVEERIAQLEAKLAELAKQDGSDWLTEARATEIRQLAAGALAASQNGRGIRLNLGGPMQARVNLQTHYDLSVPPQATYGPGPKSTTGIMNYPQDWPRPSIEAAGTTPLFGSAPSIDLERGLGRAGRGFGASGGGFGGDSGVVNVNSADLYVLQALPDTSARGHDGADSFQPRFDSRYLQSSEPSRLLPIRITASPEGTVAPFHIIDFEADTYQPELGEREMNRRMRIDDQGRPVPRGEAFQYTPTTAPILEEVEGAARQVIEDNTSKDDGVAIAEPTPLDPFAALAAEIRALDDLHAVEQTGDNEAANETTAHSPLNPLPVLVPPHDPRNGVLYLERVTLLAIELARAGHPDEAMILAGWILDAAESFEPAHAVIAALEDESLDEAGRDAALASVAADIRRSIAQAIAAAATEAELRRRLSPAIVERVLAAAAAPPMPLSDAANAPAEANAAANHAVQHPLLVTIVLDAVTDDALSALKKAGLRVIDTNRPTRVVVAEAEPSTLPAIALAANVRRIDLTEASPEGSEE